MPFRFFPKSHCIRKVIFLSTSFCVLSSTAPEQILLFRIPQNEGIERRTPQFRFGIETYLSLATSIDGDS